jgi:hypothetical protein
VVIAVGTVHRLVACLCVTSATAVVAACADPARPPRPASGGARPMSASLPIASNADSAALRWWARFPVNASPRPLVLTGPTINDPGPGFPDGDAKLAYLSGAIDLATALPAGTRTPNGQHIISASKAFTALRAMGSANKPGATRLTITGVRLGAGTFATDRGPRSLPTWDFTFAGMPQPAQVLAIPAADRWPRPGMPATDVAQFEATIAADGRHATISFTGAPPGTGPCQAQYSADITQSASAVLISVRMLTNPNTSPDTMCAAVGYARTLTVTLTPALGNRVLIDSKGNAAPVR